MTDPDPYHPVIDLTDYIFTDQPNDDNTVIELVDDSWVIEPRSPRPRRQSRVAGTSRRRVITSRGRGARTYTRTPTRIHNHVPIEIPDSPQVDTCLPIRPGKDDKVQKKDQEKHLNDETESLVRDRSPLGFGVCPICLQTLGTRPLVSTKCGHVYCQKCLTHALRLEKKCPTCRKPLKGNTAYHPLYLNRE